MRFEILGPLRVIDADGVTFPSARKIEILLVSLLIRADQVVATDALIGEIWREAVPRRATAALYVYVSQLRKFLRRPGDKGSPIVTQAPGYHLVVGSAELDTRQFTTLLDLGRRHLRASRYEEAAGCLEDASALWRGPIAPELRGGPIISGFSSWLAETQLECTEMLIDAYLHLGRHRELIGRLSTLTTEHPLHEAFHRQLMLALYRSDRQAEALDVYRAARHTLNTELGLEPCHSLQELQQSILQASRLDVSVRTVAA